jgi:two-component sensor histidine kinase
MKFFSAPISKYDDLYDQERYNFTWWLFSVLAAVFTLLVIVHSFRDDNNIYVALLALSTAILGLAIMYFSKDYMWAALIGICAGSIINQYDLFVIVSSQKFVTTLWILTISLIAYYLIGSKAGFITLFLNLIGVTIALFVVPKEIQIDRIVQRDNGGLLTITINLIIIILLISFLMHQILKSSKLAEARSRQAQQELKTQYEIVQSQSDEKTVMLKEIHHRVKNNLQVITSLLRLQSREIKDEKSIEYFHDAIQRVLAMALIHEKMYQSKDLAKIDITAYLNSLFDELVNSYSVDRNIDIDVSCEIEYMQPKSLVSFALMFNELISNSLKHAFDDIENPRIKIDIKRTKPNEVVATYFDNGTWKSPKKEASFGTELISDLCEQLDGRFELDTANGSQYTFTFDYLKID